VYLRKIFLFLLVAAIILSACGQQEKGVNGALNPKVIFKEPPELIVSSNDNEVVAVLGTYSWSYDNEDGTATGIEVDSDIPPRLVEYQEKPLNTKLNSEVNLEFAKTPQKIKVNIWNDSQLEREVTVEGTTFKTDEEGDIVYEIYATWHQGSAHYAVKINVE
jgi:hypothetical protein